MTGSARGGRSNAGRNRGEAGEIEALRARLEDAEATIEAIRSGAVDALLVRGPEGERVYTLASADRAFRELAEQMTDGAAILADDGSILWANGQLAALVDMPHERLVGTSFRALVAVLDPSTASLLRTGAAGHGVVETELVRANERPVPVRLSVSGVTIGDATARSVVASDLTEHRQAEAVLRDAAARLERQALDATEAEGRLRQLLETVIAHLPVGVVVVDRRGDVIYRNDEIERLRALVAATEAASPLFGFTPDGPATISDPVAASLAGESVDATELVATTLAGERIHVIVRAEPVRDAAGDLVAAVAVVVDVTERRRSETLRDAFIDVAAHELKTPLTTVYAAIETLLSRKHRLDRATRRELLRDAGSEAERLVHLVNDLLVLSRVERGVSFLADEPIQLARLVSAVVETEAHRDGTPPVPVHVIGEPLSVVHGESLYIEQVMANYLGNAAKYGRPPVEVFVERADDGVAVRVVDRGPGFTSEPRALFDLFYREPAVGHTSGGGIGLFVCRELVRMMGGRVWAANRPDGGAEFGFVLPVYEDVE